MWSSQSSCTKTFVESELKLENAIQIAQSLEAAEVNSKKLLGAETTVTGSENRTGSTKFSRSERGQSRQKPCYHCGNKTDLANVCPFCEEHCNKCHKKGHIARARKSTQKAITQPSSGNPRIQGSRQALTIREPGSDEEYPLNCAGNKRINPIMVELTLNGKKTMMELDTGATVSVISTQTKAQMFPQSKLMNCTLTLTTYTGELLEVAGQQILVEVKHGR